LAVLALYLWSVEGQNMNDKSLCNFVLSSYPYAYPVDVCTTLDTISFKYACGGGVLYQLTYADTNCKQFAYNDSVTEYVYNCAGSSNCPYFTQSTWYSDKCSNKANATNLYYVKNTCTPASASDAMNSSYITCSGSSYTTNWYNNGDCSGKAHESITLSAGCSLGVIGLSVKCPANPHAILSVFSFVVVAIFHFLW